MPRLSHPIALEIIGGIVVVALLVFAKTRRWLRSRFKTFDLLPEYFEAMRPEFSDVFWGVGVGAALPYLIYALYSQFAYPLVNWLAIVGAVFLGGYYLWRADHLRLEKKLEISDLHINTWTVAQGLANAGHRANAYYFGVLNGSEGTTVEGINVQVNGICPEAENLGWLPIHLHLQHDNPDKPEDQITSFNLNPGAVRKR